MSDRAIVEAVGTFMEVPAARDLKAGMAAVLGIPFACAGLERGRSNQPPNHLAG